MASLRADIDCSLEMRGPEPEIEPVELEEDIVLATLFAYPTISLFETSERAMRHRLSRTTEREDARSRKKKQTDLEAMRRAS